MPPLVLCEAIVVPLGLVTKMAGRPQTTTNIFADQQAVAARARAIVKDPERKVGYDP